MRAAFSRGALTFTKVRALTRVAIAASEEGPGLRGLRRDRRRVAPVPKT